MDCAYRLRLCRGVTLTELLCCVAVAGVLASQGLPALSGMFDRARVNSAAGDMRAAIMAARLHAMQRAQRVDVVPVADQDWNSGWVVIIDANNNQQLDPGETVLRPSSRPSGAAQVSAMLSDSKRAYLAFSASGRPRSAASPTQSQFGSFVFSHGQEKRKLVIGFLGRVRSCDPIREGAAC